MCNPYIPKAVQLVIDDVGRREGIKARGSMYRRPPVIDRQTVLRDYETIADIGAVVGMSPQTAVELCDWDRDNVCAHYPTTQWQGEGWDNSAVYGDWVGGVCRLYTERADDIEFTVHGVAHDYWIDGEPFPGEWVDSRDGEPWPDAEDHLACFKAIMAQHGLDRDLPTPFPESFVACYFQYCLRDGDPRSTGALMARHGVRYASNPFREPWREHSPASAGDGVFDSGLLLLERHMVGVNHAQVATVPDRLPNTSICGMHWGNMLAAEVADNDAVAERWIAYLREIDAASGLVLARNSEHCWSQWVYHSFAEVSESERGCSIDLKGIPERAWDEGFARAFTLCLPDRSLGSMREIVSEAFDVSGVEGRPGEVRLTLAPRNQVGGTVRW
ncbi:MAG: hypothetical protein HON70_17630 [Lentisphaerae bacterium]|nr:hypothetical protein [Lentisphaerota bacterium]